MYFSASSINPWTSNTYIPGSGMGAVQGLLDRAAILGSSLQGAINSGRQVAVDSAGNFDPRSTFNAAQTVNNATARLLDSQTVLAPAVAANLGNQSIALRQTAQSNAGLTNQQAIQTAAQTYKDVQGGGINATAYNILPYAVGGVAALALIGWILYSVGKQSRRGSYRVSHRRHHRRSSRRR